jgi:hypothetical protein
MRERCAAFFRELAVVSTFSPPVWSAQARRGRALLQWHEELREKELAKAKAGVTRREEVRALTPRWRGRCARVGVPCASAELGLER